MTEDRQTPGASGNAQPPKILVLDDDVFMLDVQSHMLADMGFGPVAQAASATLALELLDAPGAAIDVVICDLNMPDVDGIEFLRRLEATGRRVDVILLSGEGARILHTVQRLLGSSRLRILGALEKPAARSALTALLQRWATSPEPPSVRAPGPVPTPEELHAASRENQWVLHYQPKVLLGSGEFIGVEALVRWMHPTRGLVYPDHFIDAAESCDAIDELTWWVLAESMAQLARWQANGLRTRVAVNISVANLAKPHFASHVGRLAEQAGVSPQDITLEVTESRLMSTQTTPLENLVRLRLQRFGLSIDDFGTGHSSLAQVRDVPFTELKIDRGFVQGARHDQIIRPILEASISIARRLGMQSVAEGIETEDDWTLLRETRCDIGQGYFIARPMPADALQPWCDAWQKRVGKMTAAR